MSVPFRSSVLYHLGPRWYTLDSRDPLVHTVRSIFPFLKCSLARGVSHVTIKVYATAMLSIHKGFGNRPVSRHPVVKWFLPIFRRN